MAARAGQRIADLEGQLAGLAAEVRDLRAEAFEGQGVTGCSPVLATRAAAVRWADSRAGGAS